MQFQALFGIHYQNMKKGFTIIELLIVIAILSLLMVVLFPSLSLAKQKAKIVTVNSELRQIGLCLEMYMEDNNGKHPPTRQDCNMGWEDHQLPPELVDGGYLPPPDSQSYMSAGVEDRFNPGNTYKYWAVGAFYQNGIYMGNTFAPLTIPDGFPNSDGSPDTDIVHYDPKTSPVTWIIYSEGLQYDDEEVITKLHGPVAPRTWYDSKKKKGIITRVRLKDKMYEHIGTF